jgi:predicted nucleotidyltransferase
MRTSPPHLLPIFRSSGQAKLLTQLFALPEGENLTLAGLGRAAGLAPSRVHREVERLESAGLVRSERVGTARLVRPNIQSPYYPELRSLLLKAFGPAAVLEPLLREVPGVEEASLFGSWASRYLGEPGLAPGDIDLLVVGEVDPGQVYRVCRRAEDVLGRPVNPTILSRQEWTDPQSGFARAVQAGARLPLNVGLT